MGGNVLLPTSRPTTSTWETLVLAEDAILDFPGCAVATRTTGGSSTGSPSPSLREGDDDEAKGSVPRQLRPWLRRTRSSARPRGGPPAPGHHRRPRATERSLRFRAAPAVRRRGQRATRLIPSGVPGDQVRSATAFITRLTARKSSARPGPRGCPDAASRGSGATRSSSSPAPVGHRGDHPAPVPARR